MRNRHLYKSPAIEIYGHRRLLFPWLRVPYWYFWQYGVEKLLALAGDWTDNLRSQFSATATPTMVGILVEKGKTVILLLNSTIWPHKMKAPQEYPKKKMTYYIVELLKDTHLRIHPQNESKLFASILRITLTLRAWVLLLMDVQWHLRIYI